MKEVQLLLHLLCILVVLSYEEGVTSFRETTCLQAEEICPQDDKIIFWLYNSKSNGTQIKSKNIDNAPFIPGAPVKFLVHGSHTPNSSEGILNRDKSPFKQIRPYYLEVGGYNFIVVDWGAFAEQEDDCEPELQMSLVTVGNCTANIIDALCQRKDMNCDKVHVSGHSVGVVGAGVAGKFSKSLYNRTLQRITLLDPSYNKTMLPAGYLLNKVDAKQVDVIHTNIGGVGMLEAIGTVDFYFNGGSVQPGCNATDDKCNHLRAADFYGESILPINTTYKGFWGYKCSLENYKNNNCTRVKDDSQFVLWGENLPHDVEGIYMVDTDAKSPFALGKTQKGSASVNSFFILTYIFSFLTYEYFCNFF